MSKNVVVECKYKNVSSTAPIVNLMIRTLSAIASARLGRRAPEKWNPPGWLGRSPLPYKSHWHSEIGPWSAVSDDATGGEIGQSASLSSVLFADIHKFSPHGEHLGPVGGEPHSDEFSKRPDRLNG